jgi:hypothetical protein
LKAVALRQPFVALMLESSSVVIFKQVVHSLSVFEGQRLRPDMKYFTATNKSDNDIQFRGMRFHPTIDSLFHSNFSAKLTPLSFNAEEDDRTASQALSQLLKRNIYA